jgi:hypothetical protein
MHTYSYLALRLERTSRQLLFFHFPFHAVNPVRIARSNSSGSNKPQPTFKLTSHANHNCVPSGDINNGVRHERSTPNWGGIQCRSALNYFILFPVRVAHSSLRISHSSLTLPHQMEFEGVRSDSPRRLLSQNPGTVASEVNAHIMNLRYSKAKKNIGDWKTNAFNLQTHISDQLKQCENLRSDPVMKSMLGEDPNERDRREALDFVERMHVDVKILSESHRSLMREAQARYACQDVDDTVEESWELKRDRQASSDHIRTPPPPLSPLSLSSGTRGG